MSRTFQECILTEQQALEAVDRWKRALSLDEWEIFLLFIPTASPEQEAEAEEGKSVRGWLNPCHYTKTGVLCVIDPTDEERKSNPMQPWDMEKTIVHELLHIHFSNTMQHYDGLPDKYEIPVEQAIELIASALVAAYRQEL